MSDVGFRLGFHLWLGVYFGYEAMEFSVAFLFSKREFYGAAIYHISRCDISL